MKPQPYITRDPFNQKDTISVWGILGPPVKIVLIIYASFWLMAFFPSINEWLDKHLDKSDQQKTGIVLLLIFLPALAVMFFLAKKKF